MKRKCLVVGIILLFIGTAIIPSSGQKIENLSFPASRGHWLCVGGSGPGNYTSIASAIRDASDGDTIFVFHDSSPYYEHVTIDKKISLIGENKKTTVIDGQYSDDVVHISSDHVILSGFTLTRGGKLGFPNYDDAGVDIESNYNNITDNLIQSNGWFGVLIGSYNAPLTAHNQISHNVIINNSYGVYMMWSIGNVVRNNTVCDNRREGFYLSGSPCSSNKIIDNNISFNRFNGVRIEDGSSNIIEGNIISSNNESGIDIAWDSNSNKIINNHIEKNLWDGIYLFNGQHGVVTGNTIGGNQLEGLKLDGAVYTSIINNSFISDGLFLNSYQGNSISGNTVNGKPLLYLNKQQDQVIENAGQVIVVECNSITIKNCNISYTDWGILLSSSNDCSILNNHIYNITENAVCIFNSTIINIQDNNISQTGAGGIFVQGGSSNTFINNSIVNNIAYGMDFDSSSHNVLRGNVFSNDGDYGIWLAGAYDNSIRFNDFLNNTHVIIESAYLNGMGFNANHWFHNYWGRPHVLPKAILGIRYFYINIFYGILIPIPIVNFDFFPAQTPNHKIGT